MPLTARSPAPPTAATRLSPAHSPDPMWLGEARPAAAPTAWRPSVTRPPVLQAPPKLLAKVGEAFAATLAGLHDSLRSDDPAARGAALEALERLENLGLQVQQMARMMGHDGTQAAESVDLHEALSREITQWSAAAAANGFSLTQPDDTTAHVRVDPALLDQLLDLAFELAFETGDSLAVRVRPQPASRQALLLIDVQRGHGIVPAAAPSAPPDEAVDTDADHLRWLMLVQVARSGGIAARREASGSMLSVVLTFPLAELGGWYDTATDQAMGSSV